jgi:hypothetical protein
MKYQPTESELLEMGFEKYERRLGTKTPYIEFWRYELIDSRPIDYMPNSETYVIDYNINFYPTSKSDIETLIKLLTP